MKTHVNDILNKSVNNIKRRLVYMEVKNFEFVRDNLEEIIDKVNANNEPILIKSEKQNAVILSESEYNQIAETLYLQKSKANFDRINQAIENLDYQNKE